MRKYFKPKIKKVTHDLWPSLAAGQTLMPLPPLGEGSV